MHVTVGNRVGRRLLTAALPAFCPAARRVERLTLVSCCGVDRKATVLAVAIAMTNTVIMIRVLANYGVDWTRISPLLPMPRAWFFQKSSSATVYSNFGAPIKQAGLVRTYRAECR